VTAVLEGGVQRAGEQVRINVQLIDARTDDHIWSQIYDRKLTAANIFAIQSEIAESIAEALRASLTTEARQRIDSVPTKSLSALEEYFLGRQSVAQRKITEIELAAKHFENAVELDPNFALAWVGLADTYILQWAYGRDVAKDEMFARSRDATDRALQIDPDLGEAYASVGKRRNFEGDPEGAEAAFKRAIQLNPNYAPAYQWYAEMLRDLSGRVDDALDMSSKAVERDPQSAIIRRDYGLVLENAGRYDESLEQYRRAIEIIPNFGPALWDMAFLQWNVYGRVDIAIACLSRLVSDDPDAFAMIALTMAYLELGDSQQAEAWLERSMELRLDRFSYSVSAMLHLHRGDLATAVEFAEKALEGPRSILFGWIMLALLRDSDFETGNPARSLARYELSYPELLNENGPEIDRTNLNTAIGLAAVHLNLGEAAKAERLLGRCQSVIETLDRMGWQGFGIADVHIHALRGDEDKALSALRQAVEEGWRTEWWFHLKYDTNLQSLRDESEFQALSSAVEADMAEQLRRVRDWGGDGEWPPLPGM